MHPWPSKEACMGGSKEDQWSRCLYKAVNFFGVRGPGVGRLAKEKTLLLELVINKPENDDLVQLIFLYQRTFLTV